MAVAMAPGLLDVTRKTEKHQLQASESLRLSSHFLVSVTAKRQLQNMVPFDVPIISKHIQSSSQAGLFEYKH